ncbi:hypothetical protein Tco_1193022 [Tanacetum coccineum]
MGQSVTSKVCSGMQEGLLESIVIIDDTAEGEKNKKDKDANLTATHGEHQLADKIHSSRLIFESQGEQPAKLEFSPTPPREPTPPRDSAKGKEVTIVKEPVNELVLYQEEGGSIPRMPKIKSFITLEETLSQEEFNNQIKEMKRLAHLKAEKEKSELELRKMFNQATLKAQA